MAGIPTNFQAISNVLSNYNFVDIASGTGYINFYAGKASTGYLLSNYSYYSDVVASESASITTSTTKALDLDFDVLINRPLTVQGKTVINVPLRIVNSTNTSNGYIIAKVRKWDGVTETDIASCQSANIAIGGTGTTGHYMKALDVVLPLTVFKIGETLRLTIEVWGWHTGTGNGVYSVAHDPMNRTAGWDTTGAVPSRLIFQCPVRLNL